MRNGIFKALSHPTRRQLLELLRHTSRSAGDLADQFDISWPTLSRHLSVLKEADLVSSERRGNSLIYSINTSVIEDAASALLDLANVQCRESEDVTYRTKG
ncbi:autorepressor SdpR family transcription factor [Litorimonas sp. WD9-15]|uniref:autorepressor SdpR family transcription factor n=1 Tax=Litorimonas sp. WD9-15 TaxID=3418716 RepID=UPI003D00BD29